MTEEASDLFYAIHHCRAMRRLKTDPVPDDLIMKLIDAANQAPTDSNQQHGRWLVVREPSQKVKLAELNRKGIEDFIPNLDDIPDDLRAIVKAVFWQRDHFHEIPVLLVPCIEFAEKQEGAWRAGADAGGSIWPAIQNLLLGARGLGLGASPTNLGLYDIPAVKAVLGLPDVVEPIAIIPIGYPLGRFGTVTRRPLTEIVHYDRW